MTSKKLLPSGSSQRPRVHVAPSIDSTYGDLAAKFAADYGLNPDEWQRFVLDDWLGRKRDTWGALTCGLAVPRQNGKNALLEMRELFGMVGLGEKILHTAHEVKTAQKHFRRLKFFFGQRADDQGAKFPELNALVEQVRSVNGQEAIFLTNGGSIELVARSKNSGRGFTVDVLVMDEAQEMSEDALEALMPTTSAAPLGNPQWIFTGTPPGPNAVGDVFTRVRREALSDHPGRLSWHEWSVDGHVNLDDRTEWRLTNPALDAGRLQLEVIEGERARFSDDGFARERLGRWPNAQAGSRRISEAAWAAIGVDEAPRGRQGYAVAYSLDGARLSLAGVRVHPGGYHVQLIDAASGDAGVGPLAEWLAERWRESIGVVVSGRAGADALQQALWDRGVGRRKVRIASTPEYLAACSMFDDAVAASVAAVKGGGAPSVTHWVSEGQHRLDDAVAVTDRKQRGTSGAWGWEATTPDGDETPLEAVSLAYWLARTQKKSSSGGAVFA